MIEAKKKELERITNPIFLELLKLKIINKKKIVKLSSSTRDKKIPVFQDTKSKVIFLGQYKTNYHYYNTVKHNDKARISKRVNKRIRLVKILKGNIKTPILDDDKRRIVQHNSILKNKKILDFGCGWGNFLKRIIKAKSLTGIELRKECIDYIQKNIKKIYILNNLNSLNEKYDIITMFHVLEHIPYQIETLKKLKNKLSKNGKIIIEVPCANDFLLSIKEFKQFTFWSEHLILHTENSLKTILKASGFKKIKIKHYQRYNFSNHLGWFIKRVPGGHIFFQNISDNKMNKNYSDYLIRKKTSDTLIAIASN
jgi:2-polyprenyl-3-methyl-5-hydroxy-6-metoxy-1,4-benzoquinol methylase